MTYYMLFFRKLCLMPVCLLFMLNLSTIRLFSVLLIVMGSKILFFFLFVDIYSTFVSPTILLLCDLFFCLGGLGLGGAVGGGDNL